MIQRQAFMDKVEEISRLRPSYQLGHDGSDGKCDCIGLAIGAIRRAGGSWTGIHGSNYAARNELDGLHSVNRASVLHPGELVLKGRAPGESGYALPSRYKRGTDLVDYYHAGVVMSVSPLDIRHCTGPGILSDVSLGKWRYAGWLRRVATDASDQAVVPTSAVAIVSTSNGGKLHLRQKPTKSCKLYWDVPCGAAVEVLQTATGSDGWWLVRWGVRVGYCWAEFLAMG